MSSPVPDPFTLQSQSKGEFQGIKWRVWLHPKILDKSAFNECIKILATTNLQVQIVWSMRCSECYLVTSKTPFIKCFVIMGNSHHPCLLENSDTILLDKVKGAETEI